MINNNKQTKARPIHVDFSRLLYQLFSMLLLFFRYKKVSIRGIELGSNTFLAFSESIKFFQQLSCCLKLTSDFLLIVLDSQLYKNNVNIPETPRHYGDRIQQTDRM